MKSQNGSETGRSFESTYDRLVEIVEALEKGEGSLSEMTALFEEGVHLAKSCAEELDSIEKKVEVLLGEEPEEFDLRETDGE